MNEPRKFSEFDESDKYIRYWRHPHAGEKFISYTRRKAILFHLTWKSLFHHVLDPSLSLRCYGCATRTCPVQWYRQCHLLDPSQRIKSSFGNFLGEFKDQLPTPTLWNLPPGILRTTGFCSATTLKTAYNLSENMYIAFINQWRYFSRIR